MNLYIEKFKLGDSSNISFYTALEAFHHMGFSIIEVENIEDLSILPDNIFVGSFQYIHAALIKMGIIAPNPIDYPESLSQFLGRKIETSTINEIANNPSKWNVFVKPKGYFKKFTGRVIRGTNDLIGCGDSSFDTPIWVSETVNFIAEWRVFVRYGKVLGAKPYKGSWKVCFDSSVIENAISAFIDAPASYTLDIGVTKDGRTLLIEVNDGYSVGNYGLFYIDYAKFLSARWAEITLQEDLCNF